MTTRNASHIKFGVEIESFLPSSQSRNFRNGTHTHGNQITHAPNGWNAQHDGSLTHGGRGRFASETVSPILSGENGLAESFYMCEYLNEINARTNGTCGLHVHVNARGYTSRQIANIKRAFVWFEKAFFGLAGREMPTRFESVYCAPSHLWTGDRRQSLNLENVHGAKGTVEIRCFPGTTSPEIVTTAAYMAVGLVAWATRQEGYLTEAQPIIDPLEAARAFCETVFSDRRNRIVPDESADDVIHTLARKCSEAKGELHRRAVLTHGSAHSYRMAIDDQWVYNGARQIASV